MLKFQFVIHEPGASMRISTNVAWERRSYVAQ
jgi:hypothetical protein